MTPLIDKYIGKDKAVKAIEQYNFNEECREEFILFLDQSLSEIEQYNEFEAYESIDDILNYPLTYIGYYAQSRNTGFSVAWSRNYANSKSLDDTNHLLVRCYEASKEEDETQALNDLKTYCKITDRSQFFTDYLIKRINDGDCYDEKSIEKVVEEYELQLSKGNIDFFADTITTSFQEFDSKPSYGYSKMYQIHFFSPIEIVSKYYEPIMPIEDIQKQAEKWQKEIQEKSDRNLTIKLYQTEGIFIISYGDHFIDEVEVYEFSLHSKRYEYSDFEGDIYALAGKTPIDEFIKNALNTVGANSIIPVIEPHLSVLRENQIGFEQDFEKQRILDKESPNYIVEVYRIEKDYKPGKFSEFKVHSIMSIDYLPELHDRTSGERIAYVVKEIETGKTIENNIQDVIERIKYNKWQRKHPMLIDMEDMHRMELDSDDPDFLSIDDYVANDDEYEEGDEDYEPRF